MSEEETLVRLQGGDVVRRRVASRPCIELMDGTKYPMLEEPEIADDELIVRTLNDPIPLVVKTR